MLKAAIIVEGKTFTGHSHGEAIMSADFRLDLNHRKEGFITEDGAFLNRQEAFIFAKENGLIDSREYGNTLQSWMLR